MVSVRNAPSTVLVCEGDSAMSPRPSALPSARMAAAARARSRRNAAEPACSMQAATISRRCAAPGASAPASHPWTASITSAVAAGLTVAAFGVWRIAD